VSQGRVLARPDDLPSWLEPLLARVAVCRTEDFTPLRPPPGGGRPSAVLVLLGTDESGRPDLLILQRAATMRNHAGQPAFPGGGTDPEDADAVATALREANEEVGLDPASVEVLGTLPAIFIPVTGFVVTPVLAWWREPHPVEPVDLGEVAGAVVVPIAELADPANRFRVPHPSGWIGPGFRVAGLFVWGFTAGLLDRMLAFGGWERPWDTTRHEPLPERLIGRPSQD
jgi:8-oxo-dGTP pyrophosphatase MutT (NUDIX family)